MSNPAWIPDSLRGSHLDVEHVHAYVRPVEEFWRASVSRDVQCSETTHDTEERAKEWCQEMVAAALWQRAAKLEALAQIVEEL